LPPEPGFTSATDFIDTQVKLTLTDELHITYLFGHVRAIASEITSTSDNPVSGSAVSYAALLSGGFAFGALTNDQKEGGINQLNSHELRFDYSHDHLNALLGLYRAVDLDRYQFNIWQVPNGQGIDGDPSHPLDFSQFPFELQSHHLQTDTTAEFGRLSYGFIDDRATAAVEVRHSEDSLQFLDEVSKTAQQATFVTTTPRVTFDFKVTPQSMLYVSAAEGTKEGGFNGTTGASGLFNLLPSQQTFNPETNWTYEMGSKNALFGGRMIVNADLFLVKWKDLQIQEQPSNTPPALAGTTSVITTNLGAATSYGLETNGAFAATRHLDLTYALAVLNPTFDSGTKSQRFFGYCDGSVCPANDSVAGKTLPRTSKLQAAGGTTWSDTIFDHYRWNLHGEFTYQSKQQVEEMNLAQIQSRLLFNASLGIKGDNWDVTLWGKNIFDKKYVADSYFILAGSASYAVSLGELATGGITAAYHY
jgi:iron complex outermembrane receptor protein